VKREQIARDDFPSATGGYDRPSVDAHLEAVAALTGALEARIRALEVERDTLRLQAHAAAAAGTGNGPAAGLPLEPEAPSATDAGEAAESVRAADPQAAQSDRDDDEVSARLVATRLALEGVEREQIREKLEATYDLEDSDSLIDDVLERLA
jgi:hypothetical protein